jgi:hypothetical protein
MSYFNRFEETKRKMNNLLEGKSSSYSDTTLTDNATYSYKTQPDIGDIIGVSRGFYEHYGIYIGNNNVIHFASKESDVSLNNMIIETDLTTFLRGETEFFAIDFDKFNQGMKKAEIVDELAEVFFGMDTSKVPGLEYTLLSPEETIERAKSQIGKRDYDLSYNNCEHFAMWCKTGVKECNQFLTKPYRTSFSI